MSEVDHETLCAQLRALGVSPGGVVQVHTSFRSVRPVAGSVDGLIQSLLDSVGPAGTIVMPSWPEDADHGFDPTVDPADPDLGAVADRFWRHPDAARNDHPAAFAAIGPAAERILRDPLALPPHLPESPVGRVRDLDGHVLLLGVNHDANTTIHLAELVAGVGYRRQKHCTVRRGEELVRIEYGENDHCCQRFRLADRWFDDAGVQRKGQVGNADARLLRARDVVEVVADRLTHEPLFFLHEPEVGCAQCDDARASLEKSPGSAAVGET